MNIFHFLYEGIAMALNALFSNKIRTFLTMLGVATGIFAISAILTMVNSMKYSLSENLSALGNTTMFVHNWPWKNNSQDWFKFFNRPKVSFSDYMTLKEGLDKEDIEGIAYEVSVMGKTVKGEGRSFTNVVIQGVTEDYVNLNNLKVDEGRFFTEIEIAGGNPVCVVGANIANGLFPNQSAIGKFVRLGGNRAKIVGILEKKGAGIFGGSQDDGVLIPYLFAARNYNMNQRSVDKLIMVKAKNYEDLDFVESEIIGKVRANRGLKPGVEDNFSINKQEMLMKQIDTIFQYMEDGGIIITVFSLLIGGFSIFNIMYISVKKRTNEIGIQKALGATSSFILYQFIIESVITCVLGGLLGLFVLFLGAAAAKQALINSGISLTIMIEMWDVWRAIILSIIIGLTAGALPASMAARLDPVIAIRAK